MYLNCVIPYQANDISHPAPRDDFVEYCNDLQRTTGGFLHKSFLKDQFGFSFSRLFDAYIACHPNALAYFEEAGYCIIIHASCEYDPMYSHIAVYLAQQYGIQSEIIDIAEQGVLSLVSALHILRVLFSNHKMHHAIILGFDQRIIPVTYQRDTVLPDFNGVALFFLSKSFDRYVASIACLHADMISITDNRFVQFALHLKQQYQTDSCSDVFCYVLTTRKNTPNFFQAKSVLTLSICRMGYGIFPIFLFLEQLLQDAESHPAGTLYILLIEDEQLNEKGVVVLKKNKD